MALCRDYMLSGMEEEAEERAVFGIQVFEGLSQGEGN